MRAPNVQVGFHGSPYSSSPSSSEQDSDADAPSAPMVSYRGHDDGQSMRAYNSQVRAFGGSSVYMSNNSKLSSRDSSSPSSRVRSSRAGPSHSELRSQSVEWRNVSSKLRNASDFIYADDYEEAMEMAVGIKKEIIFSEQKGEKQGSKGNYAVRDDRIRLPATEKLANNKKPAHKIAYRPIENHKHAPSFNSYHVVRPVDTEYRRQQDAWRGYSNDRRWSSSDYRIDSMNSLPKIKNNVHSISGYRDSLYGNDNDSKDIPFSRAFDPASKKLKYMHSTSVKQLQSNGSLADQKLRKRSVKDFGDFNENFDDSSSSDSSTRCPKVAKLSKFVGMSSSSLSSHSFQNKGKSTIGAKKPQPQPESYSKLAYSGNRLYPSATNNISWSLDSRKMEKNYAKSPYPVGSEGRSRSIPVHQALPNLQSMSNRRSMLDDSRYRFPQVSLNGKMHQPLHYSVSKKDNANAHGGLLSKKGDLSSLDVLVQAASGFEAQLRTPRMDQHPQHPQRRYSAGLHNCQQYQSLRKMMKKEDSDDTLESDPDAASSVSSESQKDNGYDDDDDEDSYASPCKEDYDEDDDDSSIVNKILLDSLMDSDAPLVRSRRGRTQTLPSRFRDSVLDDPWKKPKFEDPWRKPKMQLYPEPGHFIKNRNAFNQDTKAYAQRFHDGEENKFSRQTVSGSLNCGSRRLTNKVNYRTYFEEQSSSQENETDASGVKVARLEYKKDRMLKKQDYKGKFNVYDALYSEFSSPSFQKKILNKLKESENYSKSKSGVEQEESKTTTLFSVPVGDVLWVKLEDTEDLFWPAKVIDPSKVASESLLKDGKSDQLCVMFYGPSGGKERKREYAWVDESAVVPFMENLDRFQSQMLPTRSEDFIAAVKDAILEECGIEQCNDNLSRTPDSCEKATDESISDGANISACQDVPRSNELLGQKDMCTKVDDICTQSRIGNQEETSSNHILERKETVLVVPDYIPVVCYGMEGKYIPKYHQVLCECSFCKRGQLMGPSKWERHTGSRKKKWKESIKLKDSSNTLLSWLHFMLEHGASGLAYTESNSNLPSRQRERKLAAYLQAPYQPVIVNWTAERCAVCRWIEDYEWNKIIICNRCGIAVHEECYGKKASNGHFICRVCENPDVEHECCLCPVKGGALKPSTIYGFWVHITCAWFIEEVSFKNAVTMEPADGLTKIDAARFREVCSVCKQIHGVCIQCAKCSTSYHVMCAARAGYRMELHSIRTKNGNWLNKKVTYCANHRAPDPDAKLVLASSDTKQQPGNNLEMKHKIEMPSVTDEMFANREDTIASQCETSSASRCQEYSKHMKLWKVKRTDEKAIAHTVAGYSWHTPAQIYALRPGNYRLKEKESLQDRIVHLQRTEKSRVCLGRSAIHGWGLFARRPIEEGEMVVEYRGDLVRRSIADMREKRYTLEGKGCYFFKISDEVIIDATEKGNMGRLINHSCAPNCYARIFSKNGEGETCIILIARRSLNEGEELTYDYQFDPENKEVPCLCGAETCRKFMC